MDSRPPIYPFLTAIYSHSTCSRELRACRPEITSPSRNDRPDLCAASCIGLAVHTASPLTESLVDVGHAAKGGKGDCYNSATEETTMMEM